MASDLHQRQENLMHFFHQAPICKTYGMRMLYDESGSAIFELRYNPNFNHTFGGIHGGVIATLLDNAGWFTVAPHSENWIATVEFTTRLLEAVKEVDLRSRGTLVRLGKKLSVANMEVRTFDDRLIAIGSGTFANTSVPLQTN